MNTFYFRLLGHGRAWPVALDDDKKNTLCSPLVMVLNSGYLSSTHQLRHILLRLQKQKGPIALASRKRRVIVSVGDDQRILVHYAPHSR
ncbi:hypothetical protein WG66_003002 [Moniliophthora roreri]|nr:hypothetical protein WG66_003002 [Moniliophthora roreri]